MITNQSTNQACINHKLKQKIVLSSIKCRIQLNDMSLFVIVARIDKINSKFTKPDHINNSILEFQDSLQLPIDLLQLNKHENSLSETKIHTRSIQLELLLYKIYKFKQKQMKQLIGMSSMNLLDYDSNEKNYSFGMQKRKLRLTNSFDKEAYFQFYIKKSVVNEDILKTQNYYSSKFTSKLSQQIKHQISSNKSVSKNKFKNSKYSIEKISQFNKTIDLKRKKLKQLNNTFYSEIQRLNNENTSKYSSEDKYENILFDEKSNKKQPRQTQQTNKLIQICQSLKYQNQQLITKIQNLQQHIINKIQQDHRNHNIEVAQDNNGNYNLMMRTPMLKKNLAVKMHSQASKLIHKASLSTQIPELKTQRDKILRIQKQVNVTFNPPLKKQNNLKQLYKNNKIKYKLIGSIPKAVSPLIQVPSQTQQVSEVFLHPKQQSQQNKIFSQQQDQQKQHSILQSIEMSQHADLDRQSGLSNSEELDRIGQLNPTNIYFTNQYRQENIISYRKLLPNKNQQLINFVTENFTLQNKILAQKVKTLQNQALQKKDLSVQKFQQLTEEINQLKTRLKYVQSQNQLKDQKYDQAIRQLQQKQIQNKLLKKTIKEERKLMSQYRKEMYQQDYIQKQKHKQLQRHKVVRSFSYFDPSHNVPAFERQFRPMDTKTIESQRLNSFSFIDLGKQRISSERSNYRQQSSSKGAMISKKHRSNIPTPRKIIRNQQIKKVCQPDMKTGLLGSGSIIQKQGWSQFR